MNPVFLGAGAVMLFLGVFLIVMAKKEIDQTTMKYKGLLGIGIMFLLGGLGMMGYGALSGAGGAASEEVAKTELGLNALKKSIKETANAASADAIIEEAMTKQATIGSQIQSVAAAKIQAAQNVANKQVANATAAAQAEAAARTTKLQQNLALAQAAAEAHKQALTLQAQLKAQAAQTEAAAGL